MTSCESLLVPFRAFPNGRSVGSAVGSDESDIVDVFVSAAVLEDVGILVSNAVGSSVGESVVVMFVSLSSDMLK